VDLNNSSFVLARVVAFYNLGGTEKIGKKGRNQNEVGKKGT